MPYDPSNATEKSEASDGINTLHVRLVGFFESAITGQEGYDAISGASTSVTENKNSNVVVQAAVLPDGTEPEEDDWENLSDTVTVNTKETTVNLDSASGMIGVYSVYDSSLTLAGTPNQTGVYPVTVTVTDNHGRKATSNALTFTVYSANEKLVDHLTLENSTPTADGKYMYDMEPWAMAEFGGDGETVTVPKDIKAWYGSHTSGTYGELGYAVADGANPEQTLIIPDGCNLTLVNMKLLSSVKIVVENGGKLNLRDSSVHGQVEVKAGGSFSMNYDEYSGEFLTGSSINGQVILDEGATLASSLIYSNTNYLPNGTEARHNTSPVVVVRGNAKITGEVYIRGDEAATGTDEATGKSYSGQPALKVESGTLTITEGSVLAVYGGGRSALTSVGGDALVLDNAEIAGAGMLIAVGGSGTFDNGGNAVTGSGTVSVASAYLEGGASYFPKDETITAGKSAGNGITISDGTQKKQVEGKLVTSNSEPVSNTYWNDTATKPDITIYDTAPSEQESESGSETDSDTQPGTETTQPGTETAQPGTETTQPGTETAQPGTEAVQPGTEAAQSGAVQTNTEQASAEGQQTFALTLKKTSFVYNGKARKPAVTVTLNGAALDQSNYTVAYKNNKKAGVATVTVTGTGAYAGYSDTESFLIRPKKTQIKSAASNAKEKLTVKWKRNKQASGYEIQVCTKKKFKSGALTYTVKGGKKTSATITKNLKSGTKYYVRLRAYKTVDGEKIYSKWSAKKQVTVK